MPTVGAWEIVIEFTTADRTFVRVNYLKESERRNDEHYFKRERDLNGTQILP